MERLKVTQRARKRIGLFWVKNGFFCIFRLNLHIFVQNTEISNAEVLSDFVILKTKLGHCGWKIKILGILHIFVDNTEITNEEILGDSVIFKSKLGRFGWKIKMLHILYQIAYFDMEHQDNQWGGSKWHIKQSRAI